MASHPSNPNTKEADTENHKFKARLAAEPAPVLSCLPLPTRDVYLHLAYLKKKICLYFSDSVPEIELLDQTV